MSPEVPGSLVVSEPAAHPVVEAGDVLLGGDEHSASGVTASAHRRLAALTGGEVLLVVPVEELDRPGQVVPHGDRPGVEQPSVPRATITLSRPICTVRNPPGPATSAERMAQNHIDSKIAACSALKMPGSV